VKSPTNFGSESARRGSIVFLLAAEHHIADDQFAYLGDGMRIAIDCPITGDARSV